MPSPVINYSWNFEGAVLMMVNIVWPPGGVKTAKDALLLPRKLHWNPEISETNGGNRIFGTPSKIDLSLEVGIVVIRHI